MKKATRYAIAVFIPVHLLVIIWTTLLPVLPFYPSIEKSKTYRQINRFFNYYLVSTGNAQRWNLFTSVSDVNGQEVVIEVTDQNGEKSQFDPILPGLKEHDSKNIRHVSFFLRVVYGMDSYAAPYMQRVFREIEKSGTKVREGYLIVNERKTRYLKNITKDNIIYYIVPHQFGPYEPHR